jgi:hypothetical protein
MTRREITRDKKFLGVLTCQSGCILEVLNEYLMDRNLIMPLDLVLYYCIIVAQIEDKLLIILILMF